ncbi:MAG: pilus assembly protein PilP [Betaproteobacteria bacterium]
MKTAALWLAAWIAAACLSGCGDSTDQELQQWLKAERAAPRSPAKPLRAPVPFVPMVYDASDQPDPFGKAAFDRYLTTNVPSANPTLVAPELARRRQPLEAFALESIALVGTLAKEGKRVALVRAEGALYQVAVGNYLGKNFGKITKVDDSGVVLREIAQDATGEWVVRVTSLKMQEGSK